MKSKTRRRVIALVLCMVMLLSCGVTTLAEGNTAEPAVTGETAAQENVSAETQTDTAADDAAVVSESQEKMAAAETAETETEGTASSDITVQSETADTEGTESAQTEESTVADTTEQTAGTESGDAAVQSEEETTAGNDTAETSEPETSTENETQDDTAEKTEKAAQPYSEEYEDDTIKISVSAEAGIVPEGAKLSVTPIEKTEITDDMTAEEKAEAEKINDQYDLTEKKLNEDSEENEETMEGFLAYDISFLVNGEEVEPSGDVNVIMEFKEAAVPEGVSEDAAVTVKHLKEDETAEDGVVVEDMADKAEVQTTEKAEVEKVEMTSDTFSTFTITWIQTGEGAFESFKTKIHVVTATADSYVGLNDIDLTEKNIESVGTPPTLYIDTISASGTNSDLYNLNSGTREYHFTQAFVASQNGNNYSLKYTEAIDAIQAMKTDEVRYKLQGAGEYATLATDEVIIFVYTSEAATTNAFYYSEDGERLRSQSTYNYAQIGSFDNPEDGVYVKDNIPSGAEEIKGYTYAYTLINKGGQQIEPNYMRYFNEELQYSLSDSDIEESERVWVDIGVAEIRLIYIPNDTVKTVDTSGIVDIGLYDLEQNNELTDLRFSSGKLEDTKKIWDQWTGFYFWENRYTGKNLAMQGIVQDELYSDSDTPTSASENYEGYPKLNVENEGWLEPLFKNGYTGLNHLFRLDSEGYYYYDSSDNYAYFNTNNNNKNFTVYSRKQNKGDDDKGDFMPFDKITEHINDYNDNFYFSMNIGFNFTQPQDGKINDKNMVFEFSGDDDVWVFIDGKLVLDIGGIHDAVSGSIDFATGKISVNPGAAGTYTEGRKTYRTRYTPEDEKALDIEGNRINTGDTLQNIFELDGDTFEAGTTHRLEFFYLERGAGESNCSLRFNLQPQKSQTVEVAKEITNTDRDKYSNIEFDFKLYLEDNENSNTYHVMPEGTTYTIKKNNEEIGTGTVGENGIFTLKHGESAVFDGISSKLHYFVQEVNVDSDEFDKVEVDHGDISYTDQEDNPFEPEGGSGLVPGDKNYIASTNYLLVGEVGKVTFSNRCSAKNKNELKVTKVMKNDDQTTDSFTFKISLENQNGGLEPYEGEYYLYDSDGHYWYYEGEELVEVTDGSAPVCGRTSNGEIRNILPGYTVVITDIMSGTDFKVEEVGYDSNSYETPTIMPKVPESYGESDIDGATGVIILDKNAEVTVQNSFKVEKDWQILKRNNDHPETHLSDAVFEMKNNTNAYYGKTDQDGYVQWYSDLDCTVPVKKAEIKSGQYTLREIESPLGYTVSSETWTVIFDKDGSVPTITGCIDQPSKTQETINGVRTEITTYYFDDEILYSLPEAGGTGIYWYMLGGVLLMMAGSLLVYKKRRGEVLRRK